MDSVDASVVAPVLPAPPHPVPSLPSLDVLLTAKPALKRGLVCFDASKIARPCARADAIDADGAEANVTEVGDDWVGLDFASPENGGEFKLSKVAMIC